MVLGRYLLVEYLDPWGYGCHPAMELARSRSNLSRRRPAVPRTARGQRNEAVGPSGPSGQFLQIGGSRMRICVQRVLFVNAKFDVCT